MTNVDHVIETIGLVKWVPHCHCYWWTWINQLTSQTQWDYCEIPGDTGKNEGCNGWPVWGLWEGRPDLDLGWRGRSVQVGVFLEGSFGASPVFLQHFSLQTPSPSVDNWWSYWGYSILSTKNYTEMWQHKFVYITAKTVLTSQVPSWTVYNIGF